MNASNLFLKSWSLVTPHTSLRINTKSGKNSLCLCWFVCGIGFGDGVRVHTSVF